ncbi:hypothetical protein [Marinomonas lutimaris]|uniref:hypothetical protein n=1 Tax=Marinomonas lutimaris TaxID=2846746 RepID=UPI001CA48097|nr:hypothetical protein [Marinomonas lutimaris]
MKKYVIYSSLVILNFVVNFLIYNYSFVTQATPYLHEEQRVESAIAMFEVTVPAFFVSSCFMALLFYVAAKRLNKA